MKFELDDSLLLIGKVDEEVLNELSDLLKNESKENWYFVGYSKETLVGTYFEYNNNYIKLVSCYPDAFFKCDSIPSGYKAICQFEFSDSPIDMPTTDSWSSKRTKSNEWISIKRINIAKLRKDKINKLFDDKNN